jgi:hypothetical protein
MWRPGWWLWELESRWEYDWGSQWAFDWEWRMACVWLFESRSPSWKAWRSECESR